MGKELEILEEIDKFLNNELDEAGMTDFLFKLESDPALQALVDSQKRVNELVVGRKLSEVRNLMKEDFKSGKVKSGKNKTGWYTLSLILLTIPAIIFFYNKKDQKKKDSFKNEAPATISIIKESNKPEIIAEPSQKSDVKVSSKKTEPILLKEKPVEKMEDFPVKKELNNIENKEISEPTSPTTKTDITEQSQIVEKKEKTVETQVKAISCEERHVNATIRTEASCEEKATGIIYLENIKTSKADIVKYTLQSKDVEKLISSIGGNFSGLHSGKYEMYAEDKSGCQIPVNLSIIVPEKSCKKINSYSFSPSYSETFKFPLGEIQDGTIEIKDRSGRVIYSTEIRSAYPGEWDGRDFSGQLVPAGVYIYYLNAGNEIAETGQIVIY